MKLATVLKSFATVVIAAMTSQSAVAQSPVDMFGIGVTAGSGSGSLELSYAFSPAIQAGAGLGLEIQSMSHDGESTSSTNVVFAPFVRYIFGGTTMFRPFINGQFFVSSNSGSNSYPNYEGDGSTTTGIGLGGGVIYSPIPPIQITGQMNVGEFTFGDLSTCDYGLLSGRIGLAWFWECCWME